MVYQLKMYLQFLLKATNQHGVHSPFIFDFVTKCLYDSKKYSAYAKLEQYRKSLLKDQQTVEVTDFGAGSLIFKSSTRKISDIAKHAGATTGRMRLLYRITSYFKPEHILELGTSLGLATLPLALSGGGKIETVEGCQNICEVAKKKIWPFKLKNLFLYNDTFTDHIKKNKAESYDIIYFDGNHNKEATLAYFEALLDTAHNNSLWIFDDIYWSTGMTQAWESIKKNPKVQVTVDCFWLGFVFFRKEQQKQHFKIRL